MEFTLHENPATFTVLIGNIKMEYPISKILDYVPLWAPKILSEKIITIDEDLNLNGVRDFFNIILTKKSNIINDENSLTILKLGESSGSQDIIEEAKTYINKNQKTIEELMKEIAEEKQHSTNSDTNNSNQEDHHLIELHLSKHYNEMLQYPEILKNIEIPKHYRIVEKALKHYQKDEFNYRGFISFVIDTIEKGLDRHYCSLLSLIELDDFDLNEIERLCKCPHFDERFLNCKVVNFINKLKENDDKVIKQEENIKNLQVQFEEFKKQNKFFVDSISSKMNEFLNNQQKYLNDVMKQNGKQINDQSEKMENLFTTQQNSINEIKQQINDQYSKTETRFTNQEKFINDFKEDTKQQINNHSSKTENSFSNQQNSINELMQKMNNIYSKTETRFTNLENNISQKLISFKTDLINEIEKVEKQNKNQSDEINKLTENINNMNKNITNIESKVVNLPSFISINAGIKEEMSRKEIDEKARYSAQQQQLKQIEENQKKIFKDLEQINMFFSDMVLKKDYLGEPFSGIISILSNKNGGNINDKNIISITGNRYTNGTFSSLVDYNYSGTSYLSNCVPNSFICFDFKDHCVSLSAYSIKSSNNSTPDYLKSWVVEGSNESNEWIELDSHTNDQTLCSKSAIHTFQICKEKKIKQPFKFIRLRMTGPSSRNDNYLELTNIEFFGEYYKR